MSWVSASWVSAMLPWCISGVCIGIAVCNSTYAAVESRSLMPNSVSTGECDTLVLVSLSQWATGTVVTEVEMRFMFQKFHSSEYEDLYMRVHSSSVGNMIVC